MSAAVAEAAVAAAPPAKTGRKKLIVIVAVVLLVLIALAAATVFVLKNRAAQAAALALDDGFAAAPAAARPDPKHPPTFLPLEPFVVNLADRDADRYAQIGITLEVDSAPFAEEMKAYMPAIRNNILMILAQKTSRELLERAGKEQLAAEVQREAVRPMGIVVSAPPESGPSGAAPAGKSRAQHNPVRQVHFSNFIIQ
jgi:flagellar FliL protein